MSKSVDLREAAVAYYEEGHTLVETGKIFKVEKTTVSNWVRKEKETGDLHNKSLFFQIRIQEIIPCMSHKNFPFYIYTV